MEDKAPPKEWPKQGQVIFEKFALRYREGLDLVIKDITATINPGEKV